MVGDAVVHNTKLARSECTLPEVTSVNGNTADKELKQTILY